jgi:catechol 2,3-dioxygenase
MRIELNSGGYRNYVPDWEPVKWLPSQGSNSMYRNSSMADSMTEAFPPDSGASFPEPAAMVDHDIINPYSKQGRG